mgnify:FL=1
MRNPINYISDKFRERRETNKLITLIKQKVIGALRDDSVIWKSLRQLLNSSEEVTTPYSQSVWVYAAISAISQSVSRVPFNLVQQKSEDELEMIEEGELYNLFSNPNPMMSMKELLEAKEIFMGLKGEAFWVFEGRENITQIPKEIWCLDPARFEPVIANGLQIGWAIQMEENKKKAIPLYDVMHFKYFNPYNMIRGLAPYQAISMAVNQSYYADSYNTNFFKDGATVGGFISFKEELGNDAYNRLVKQFEERHKGHSNAHKIGILEGGGDFKEAKLSQKDMDFVQTKKLSREEIFAAYKTNAVVLGLYEDVKSYEGTKTAHKTYWQDCLIPKCSYTVEHLWNKFFSKIGNGDMWAQFDFTNVEALQEDFGKKVVTAVQLFGMGYTKNAINKHWCKISKICL